MSAGGHLLACIVLAAGSSRRFGSDKRQARLTDGRTLLESTLQSIPSDLFHRRILVLATGDQDLAAAHATRWQVVRAADAVLGMGHSLAAGLSACADCEAALVVLADMPAVRRATYTTLTTALSRDRIVVPRHAGRRGNPVGIGADFFAGLLPAQGDSGARHLLQAHPDAIVWLDCADPGVLQDIDTPADLLQQG